MSGSDKKHQHTVPQSYLRRFADATEHIFVFDKASKKPFKSFKSKVNSIANENYFYDFNLDLDGIDTKNLSEEIINKLKDPHLVENSLGEYEDDHAPALTKMLDFIKKEKKIDQSHKPQIAHLMAIQLLRTKEFRKIISEVYEKGMTKLAETQLNINLHEENLRLQISTTRLALEQAHFLFNNLQEEFVRVFLDHIWTIGINQSNQSFYTSDNPVVREPYKNEPGYAGLASPGIQISFPLTPEYILLLYEKNMFKEIAYMDCGSLPLDNEGVNYYNTLQVKHSYRQIYCLNNEFLLATDVCNTNPEICNPDRQRIQIY